MDYTNIIIAACSVIATVISLIGLLTIPFKNIYKQFEKMDKRFDKMDQEFKEFRYEVSHRFDRVDEKIQLLDSRTSRMEGQLSERTIIKMEEAFSKLKEKE